jgi:hypothetical protein
MITPFEQLRALQPGAEHCFEHVASSILRATVADARGVRVHRGDDGVDMCTGSWGESGALDVYQIKFFTTQWSDSQKQQIRDSFSRALEAGSYNLQSWKLVVPTTLTARDHQWFDDWKQTKSVPIDLMDGAELNDCLRLPECANARTLMSGWGVIGLSGVSFLVPLLTIHRTDLLQAVINIRLRNQGDRSARGVRAVIRHTETHTVAASHNEHWWRQIPDGMLMPVNPRTLEARQAINPGESVSLLQVPFRIIPEGACVVQVRITAEDVPAATFYCELSSQDLHAQTGRPFEVRAESPDTEYSSFIPQLQTSPLSEVATELLGLLREDPNENVALHVISAQNPGDPTLKAFFIAPTDAPGSSDVKAMRIRLFTGAVEELVGHGYLHPPVPGPGTDVYEIVST